MVETLSFHDVNINENMFQPSFQPVLKHGDVKFLGVNINGNIMFQPSFQPLLKHGGEVAFSATLLIRSCLLNKVWVAIV